MSGIDPTLVDRIVDALRLGEVVLIPTDTVYGLAADPTSAAAMQRLFEAKRRPDGVPVAVLVGSPEAAFELIERDDAATALAEEHWPGALTIVGTMRNGVDLHIGGEGATLGVRCPDHELVRAVADTFGPIAATSANRHGEPTIVDAHVAIAEFPELAVAVDGGVLDGAASTVVSIVGGGLEVLRQGDVHLQSAD